MAATRKGERLMERKKGATAEGLKAEAWKGKSDSIEAPKGIWKNMAKTEWGLQVHFYPKFKTLGRPKAP